MVQTDAVYDLFEDHSATSIVLDSEPETFREAAHGAQRSHARNAQILCNIPLWMAIPWGNCEIQINNPPIFGMNPQLNWRWFIWIDH